MARLPDLEDDAEILRRALMLRDADMQGLALRSSITRRRAAEARRAEAELAEAIASDSDTSAA
jgi:hypothetical protein